MNVTIVGANGDIGREITKSFLRKSSSELGKLSLISSNTTSINSLTSFTQDAVTQLSPKNIIVGKEPKLLKGANVIVFCAGEGVNSKTTRREDLFKSNKSLFEKYLRKINNYAPNSVVFLVTNPMSQIMQHVKSPKNISIVGVGVTNDTFRLQQNFARKFNYSENNLFMVGDHLTNQEMTLSQIDSKVANQIISDEEIFFKNNKVEDMYEFIREKNYALLKENDVKKMFGFVESVPLKYQGVARQRFIHFLTKTVLSTSYSVDRLFGALTSKEKVCCEVVVDSYLGLPKSVLGVPIKFENSKVVPLELKYSPREFNVLEKCSKIYKMK